MLAWTVSSFALAQPRFAEAERQWAGEHVPVGDGYQTEDLVVLGVHPERPWVAFRRLVKTGSAEGDERVTECAYSGLSGETKGVLLGVFDLEGGQNLHAWWIYPPAAEPQECLAHDVSKQRLDEAKATFAKLGIDIARPPRPEPLSKVGLVAKASVASQLVLGEGDFKYTRQSLWRGLTELYVREYKDFHPDYHKIRFGSAYPVGSQHFVVECIFVGVWFRGGRNRCTFTPPLP